MSKRKTYNPNSLRKYLNPNPTKKSKTPPFAMMYADLQQSWQYQELNAMARCVFVAMITESGGSYDFTFPRRLYEGRYGFDRGSVNRAIKELEKAGFIRRQMQPQQETIYMFSTDWIRREKPKEKPKKHSFGKPKES